MHYKILTEFKYERRNHCLQLTIGFFDVPKSLQFYSKKIENKTINKGSCISFLEDKNRFPSVHDTAQEAVHSKCDLFRIDLTSTHRVNSRSLTQKWQ